MKPRSLMKVSTILSLILLGSSLTLGGNAYAAKGAAGGGGVTNVPIPGTAKPVKNQPAPIFVPTLSEPLLPGAIVPPGGTALSAAPLAVAGFDFTGIIQKAKVDNDNANGHVSGCSGSVTIDSKDIIIPCGLIVQMPANTMPWADFAEPNPVGITAGLEINIVGNNVGGKYIAALAYISQQSLHGGSGTITRIDYSKGEIIVDGKTTIQINDPFGRFGRMQSPDPRFSVDDQNPTIKAATGYPMCVPRTRVDLGTDDPLCPQKNRPLAAGGCRNFGDSGFAPPVSGELVAPAFGQTYCSQYVMPAIDGAAEYPTGAILTQTNAPPYNSKVRTSANSPDPRQQAPFEVGDFINYSGTLLNNGTVSAHTIEANIGIYTQPGTQPAYMAIGEFGIGTADLGGGATAINGAGIEATNRLFLEASTTDFRTPIDIYLVDDAVGGVLPGIINRWVTPWEMTGECPPANGLAAASGGTPPVAANCNGVTGGISTTLTGPQVARDRIRATKAPTGLLSRPSRTVRVMQRSLCTPAPAVNNGPGLVDACLAAASVVRDAAHPRGNIWANGLVAGQYQAPVFEYIFPENVKAGDPIIPNDFWHLPFLRFGEGTGSTAPALTPQPW